MSDHTGLLALIVAGVTLAVIGAALFGSQMSTQVDRLADPTPLPGETPRKRTQTDDGAAPAAVPPVQPADPHAAPSSPHSPAEIATEYDLLTLYDGATERRGWLGWFVVLAWGMPWIVFETEHGEHYAHTVPSDEPSDKPTIPIAALFEHGNTVQLLWDGRSPVMHR
jgi:hypothetical protein